MLSGLGFGKVRFGSFKLEEKVFDVEDGERRFLKTTEAGAFGLRCFDDVFEGFDAVNVGFSFGLFFWGECSAEGSVEDGSVLVLGHKSGKVLPCEEEGGMSRGGRSKTRRSGRRNKMRGRSGNGVWNVVFLG